MDGSVSVPLPRVRAVEMTDSLAQNFKMIWNDKYNCTYLRNPFSFEVGDAPEKLQHESVELQHDFILHSIFNQESAINYLLCFFTSISVVSVTSVRMQFG